MTDNQEYYFNLNIVGDALAYIVSVVEDREFVYTTVNTHTYEWDKFEGMVSNHFYFKAIIDNEIKECNLCVNENDKQIWDIKRLAFIFKLTKQYEERYVDERAKNCYLKIFEDSVFPYLNDFIELLESYRKNNIELTKDNTILLAYNYVKANYPYDETQEINKLKEKTIGK